MVTITEVAKRAGVSPTTASYALNGRVCVKEETRQRILEAARELEYVPNRLAQSFRNGRTNTITVVTNEAIESANTFTAEFFGILAEARAKHYDVLVKLLSQEGMPSKELQALLRNRTSDGFIFLGNLPNQYLLDFVECDSCGVLLSAHTKAPIAQVNCDGRKGIYDITRLAIRSGKKHLAYIAYENKTTEEKLRRQGFQEALKEFGRDPDEAVFTCGTNQEKIAECVAECLQKGIDCFICWNDILAYTVWDILEERQIAVPQEVGVTGFDDIQPTFRKHDLTTVRQPFLEKGKKAMTLLLEQINHKPCEKKEYLIECEIISRKSL